MTVKVKKTAEKDEARFSFGIKGRGSVEIRGTNEFVRAYTPLVNDALKAVVTEYLDAEASRGVDRQEALRALVGELDKAARKAGIPMSKEGTTA